MNEIQLFQPGSIDITLDLPATWNELQQEELLFIAENMLLPYAQPEYFYSVIFFFLINHRAKLKTVKLPLDLAAILNVEDLALNQKEALSWIHNESSLTEQLIQRINVSMPGLQFVYGPLSSFNDLSCGEFEDCEVFSHLYSIEKNFNHLAMIAAILFRPEQDGRRMPYITTGWERIPHALKVFYKEEDDMILYNAEKNKAVFAKIPPKYVLAVYMWYVGCRSLLLETFPHVFGSGRGEPDLAAFTKCIHAGAGPKNGTRDKIRRSLLKAFMMDIEQDAIQAEKLKEKTK